MTTCESMSPNVYLGLSDIEEKQIGLPMSNHQPYHEKHKVYRPETNGGGVWFPGKGGYTRDTSMFEDQPEDLGPDPLPDYATPTSYRPDNEYGFEDPHAHSDPRYYNQGNPSERHLNRGEHEPYESEYVQFLGERPRGRVHTTGTLITASCLSFVIGGAGMLLLLTVVPAFLIALLSA